MKAYLFTASLLAGVMSISSVMAQTATVVNTSPAIPASGEGVTREVVTTVVQPTVNGEPVERRTAAQRFLESVTNARVALAMDNKVLAKDHINMARTYLEVLKTGAVEERKISRLESGRVIYEYHTEFKDHYVPIETGPVTVKQLDAGPFWAGSNKGIAVTEADVVYITLDLTQDKAEQRLREAEAAVSAGDTAKARSVLAALTQEVSRVESAYSLPLDKARDNVYLARNFIQRQNYEGARYALEHAKKALDEMEKDARYTAYKSKIPSLRNQIIQVRNNADKKDPTGVDNPADRLNRVWGELHSWKVS